MGRAVGAGSSDAGALWFFAGMLLLVVWHHRDRYQSALGRLTQLEDQLDTGLGFARALKHTRRSKTPKRVTLRGRRVGV